jgi:hypothetical protein
MSRESEYRGPSAALATCEVELNAGGCVVFGRVDARQAGKGIAAVMLNVAFSAMAAKAQTAHPS